MSKNNQRAQCFVIQPFGKKPHPSTKRVIDNDRVFEALQKLGTIRSTFPIHVERADQKEVEEDALHEHVVSSIGKSDFCVADLTGQNSNVLYEIGIARGLRKRTILICQNREDVPSDLKGFLTVPYSMDGLADLPSDINKQLEGVKKDIDAVRQERALAAMTNLVYFDRRDDANIQDRIRDAQHKIDILQTNLAIIQSNYMSVLRETLKRKTELKLRLLTLDPQSIFVNYRGPQVGFKGDLTVYRQELDVNLRSVYIQLREFEDRVQIRLYDDFPTQIAFFFDDDVLSCVVSATGRSRENCAFLLRAQMPGAKRSFVDHFEHLWREEKSQAYRL